MGQYAEFRLVLSPDLAIPGSWAVAVGESPHANMVGPKGSLAPTLSRADLATLRGRNGWPNPAVLQNIGKAVWNSLMTPQAAADFLATLSTLKAGQGLRLVVVMQGQENEVANLNGVRLSELPVEALFTDAQHFIATDLMTPVSRSFQQRPDRPPFKTPLPLRVLVAVASPSDKPPANVQDEVDAIKKAIGHLSGPGGQLDVEFVQQVTREQLAARLKAKPFHVLHFIGHGGFDVVGDVEVPRAHLCFVRPNSTVSDPTDADTLSVLLRNTGVRLVVITACSSAAPGPAMPDFADPGPLGSRAFDGVAQRLVAGVSGVTAAVAMQFDLEDVAAIGFSRAFYESLLVPGVALDEVVTMARQALIAQLQAGHRAWVTPAIYWRCEDGKVFDIDPTLQRLDETTLAELRDIQAQLAVYREYVEKIAPQPAGPGSPVDDLKKDWIGKIQAGLGRRAQLAGDAIRLEGGRVKQGADVRCRLSLRIRQPGIVGPVVLQVEYPHDKLGFVLAEPGADVQGAPPTTAPLGSGAMQVILLAPSGGAPWQPQEYELGFFTFRTDPAVAPSVLDVRITSPQVTRDGSNVAITPVDAMVVVEG